MVGSRFWILVGAVLFILALAGSAMVVPELRVLHSLQALIYVAVIFLAWRDSAWGYGAGIAIAVAWNGLNMFVTGLTWAGAAAFWSFLHTGHAQRLDTMMVTFATIAHFILIVACLAALLEKAPERNKLWKAMSGGVLALAYFALIILIAAPR